jgi:hypothetical protein
MIRHTSPPSDVILAKAGTSKHPNFRECGAFLQPRRKHTASAAEYWVPAFAGMTLCRARSPNTATPLRAGGLPHKPTIT